MLLTRTERALATTELELNRRAAARITAYLARRTDLSPACIEVARAQRDEYAWEAFVIEQALAADLAIRGRTLWSVLVGPRQVEV